MGRRQRIQLIEVVPVRQRLDIPGQPDGPSRILVNCAGGNIKAAMTGGDTGFFDLDPEAIREKLNLNIMGGAVLPCMIYGPSIAKSDFGGSVINVTSMNAFRPLERRPAYAAASVGVKTGVGKTWWSTW